MLAHQFTLVEVVILAAVTIGAVTDVKTRKIYDWITLPTALAGIIINGIQGFTGASWTGGAFAVLWAMAGFVVGVGITALPSSRKGKVLLGGGDVKMWGAVGACLLPLKLLICWFYFALAFGAASFFLIGKALFLSTKDSTDTVDMTAVEAARKAPIPVGPAIAIGTYLGIIFDKGLMHFMGFSWY